MPRALTGRLSRAVAAVGPSFQYQTESGEQLRKCLNQTGAESQDCKNDSEVED